MKLLGTDADFCPEAEFAAWLRERIRRESGTGVHEPETGYTRLA